MDCGCNVNSEEDMVGHKYRCPPTTWRADRMTKAQWEEFHEHEKERDRQTAMWRNWRKCKTHDKVACVPCFDKMVYGKERFVLNPS